jgi:hypothetical protein
MAREILGGFGPDTPKDQAPQMSKNGPVECKPLAYDAPKGPMGQSHNSVGLGGSNMGCCGTQGKH